MIKRLAVLMILASSAFASDPCYWKYGEEKSECRQYYREQAESNERMHRMLDRAQDRMDAEDNARKVRTTIEDESLMHPKGKIVVKEDGTLEER